MQKGKIDLEVTFNCSVCTKERPGLNFDYLATFLRSGLLEDREDLFILA